MSGQVFQSKLLVQLLLNLHFLKRFLSCLSSSTSGELAGGKEGLRGGAGDAQRSRGKKKKSHHKEARKIFQAAVWITCA